MLCSHVITLLMIAIKGRVSPIFRVAIRWNQSHMAHLGKKMVTNQRKRANVAILGSRVITSTSVQEEVERLKHGYC